MKAFKETVKRRRLFKNYILDTIITAKGEIKR
jgi:hypothetical protein